MCFMICDRMLQSIAMLQWKPSVQAAASIYLARKYLGYEDSWVGALAGGDLEHVAGGVHGREEGGADAVRGGHSRDHHEAEPAAGGGTEVQELAIQSHLQQRTDQDAAEGGEEGGKDFVRVFVWNCDVRSLEKGNEENEENQGVIKVSDNITKANASSQNESRIMPKQH